MVEEMDCPEIDDLMDHARDEPPAPWVVLHLLVCEECRECFEILKLLWESYKEYGLHSGSSLRESESAEERLASRWMLYWEDTQPWGDGPKQ